MSTRLSLVMACLLVGCAAPYNVKVDSYGSDESIPRTFVLFEPDFLPRSDLANAEHYAQIEQALEKAGFTKTQPSEARQLIVATWAVGDSVAVPTVKYVPTMGLVPKGSTITGRAATYGNQTSMVATQTNQYQLGVTGVAPVQGYAVSTPFALVISSLDIARLPADTPPMLWKVDISTGGQTPDLRLAMPAMLSAAIPYFGKSPGRSITTTVFPESSVVEAKGPLQR